MHIPLVTHPGYSFEFPAEHRFPMQKFALLHEYLVSEGLAKRRNTLRPGPIRDDVLAMAHDQAYSRRFACGELSAQEQRRMGLPWSERLVARTFLAPAGTLLAAHYALSYGVACHLAGGTHHAHRDFASGFCVFNDIAVTALALLSVSRARNILIFDLDVHQGDGTASILQAEPRAFTCSIHCGKNFPHRKAQSDLDVELPVGCDDAAYLLRVEQELEKLLAEREPDLLIYDAGVDVYRDDPLGLLNISLTGIARRDRRVLEMARDAGVPVLTVIGGGYDRDRRALARRHGIVVQQAFAVFGSGGDDIGLAS